MGQTKVTVVPDENGNNIRQSKNPEYGFVRIVQEAASFGGRNGWANTSNRSALIKGKMEALEQLGLAKAKKLDGKIIILESTTAFNLNISLCESIMSLSCLVFLAITAPVSLFTKLL